jgi:hypothetical protein
LSLSNNKLILAYGFNEQGYKKVHELILNNNLPNCKIIDKHLANMKVKNIIEGISICTVNVNLIKEQVILFNNLEDIEFEKSIKIFRGKLSGQIIFAVVTDTSIEWTFAELLEHLVEERKWVEKRKKQ